MTHPRRIIRNAVADRLRTAGTSAGNRVWASREAPVNVESVLIEQGPIVLVYTRTEQIKPEDYPTSGFGKVRRCLELAVEITAAGADVVDDKLDELAEQVEAVLDNFDVPGLPATEIRLESTEIVTSDEFEQPLGGALLIYEARYWTDWRVDDDDDFLPCGGDIRVVRHVGGVNVGAEEIAGCEDCGA